MSDNEPFADLPDALIRDLLAEADKVGERVQRSLTSIHASRPELRRRAHDQKLILNRADLDVVREPSVSGFDGSYQIQRLTSIDLCAAAAVGVEGTSKESRRKWDRPYHMLCVESVAHSMSTTNALRGVMVAMELLLAKASPHDVALLDGSFSPLVIYLNQGRAVSDPPLALRRRLDEMWEGAVNALLWAIGGDRAVALPKYATRNELAVRLGTDASVVDGKTLATAILEPGEYTSPLRVFVEEVDRDYHVAGLDSEKAPQVASLMKEVEVIYFRPFSWLPALRVELPAGQAGDLPRRALVLEGIARQLFTPAVIEPYPLYLADRMAKSLGAGVGVLEQTVSQYVLDGASDVEGSLLLLRQHRTEGGRSN